MEGWALTDFGAELPCSATVSWKFVFPFVIQAQWEGSEWAFWRGIPSRNTSTYQNLRGDWYSESGWSYAVGWRTIEGCECEIGRWMIVLVVPWLHASNGLLGDVSSCWTIGSGVADKDVGFQWAKRVFWDVDPAKRITVREALESEFVAAVRRPEQEVGMKEESDTSDWPPKRWCSLLNMESKEDPRTNDKSCADLSTTKHCCLGGMWESELSVVKNPILLMAHQWCEEDIVVWRWGPCQND